MIDDIINDLKHKGSSLSDIIQELKRKDIDPKAGYRILRFYFTDQDLEIRKKIIQIYSLDSEYSFDNPFTKDFLS